MYITAKLQTMDDFLEEYYTDTVMEKENTKTTGQHKLYILLFIEVKALFCIFK